MRDESARQPRGCRRGGLCSSSTSACVPARSCSSATTIAATSRFIAAASSARGARRRRACASCWCSRATCCRASSRRSLPSTRRPSPPVPLGQLLVTKGAVARRVAARSDHAQGRAHRVRPDRLDVRHFPVRARRGPRRPEIALAPGDVIPQLDINTEMVLIEALRLFDERNRAGEAAPPAPPSAASPALVAPTTQTIQIVTDDVELVVRLGAHIAPSIAVRRGRVARRRCAGAGRSAAARARRRAAARASSPSDRSHAQAPSALARRRGDRADAWTRVTSYAVGVAAVVPADAVAIAACCGTLLGARSASITEGAPIETRTGIARLRRVIADLAWRAGVRDAVAQPDDDRRRLRRPGGSVPRPARHDDRARRVRPARRRPPTRGATQGVGIPIARRHRTRFVREPRDARARWTTSRRHSRQICARSIDRPRSGQSVLFPVLGSRRVIATDLRRQRKAPAFDRRRRDRRIATAQVGLAFENELLRRQLDRGAYQLTDSGRVSMPKKILLVDDSNTVLLMERMILSHGRYGYAPRATAERASSALAKNAPIDPDGRRDAGDERARRAGGDSQGRGSRATSPSSW